MPSVLRHHTRTYNLYRHSCPAPPRSVRQSGLASGRGPPQYRRNGRKPISRKRLAAAGFVRQGLGSLVDSGAFSAPFPGSFIVFPGSLVDGCCIKCNIPGHLLRQMQHLSRRCCIRCNNPSPNVASHATTRAEMMHEMQQPERRDGDRRAGDGGMIVRLQQPDGLGRSAYGVRTLLATRRRIPFIKES